MGYHTSNAAVAYDFQEAEELRREVAPHAPAPRFDVYTGAGRQADQLVSPAFVHVVKVFVVLALIFVGVGIARVAIFGATNAAMNETASIREEMDAAVEEGRNLQVMQSVYGADARIKSIATGTLGMVEPEDRVVLDVSGSSDAASADADAAPASSATE